MPKDTHVAWALFRFHLKVGVRAALRNLTPVIGVFLFFYYILRPEFLVFFIRLLLFENGLLLSALTLAFVGLFSGRVASSRVLLGAAGWIRHLPLTSAGHRRLSVLSAALACLPVYLILTFIILVPGRTAGRPSAFYLAGLPFLALASTLFWTPVKHRLAARPLAFLSCLLIGTGQVFLLTAGIAALVAADLAAGPLRRAPRVYLFVPKGRSPALGYLISLRAVGWKFVPLYLLSFVVLILSQLFIINNRFIGHLAGATVRFGGMLSTVLFLGLLANVLSVRRPPWPWVRSLPFSSRSRVIADAVFLAVPSLSLVAVVVALNTWAGLATLVCLPLLSLRAAAHLYRNPEHRSNPALAVILEGGLAALALALAPWLAAVSLAGLPLALADAARQERQLKVSRWAELHHLAAGDSQSWSSV